MSDAIVVGLLVLLGTALTGAGAFWGVRRQSRTEERRTSGSIRTSEAETLWDQAEQIRSELRAELERQRVERQQETAQLRQDHANCEDRVETLRTELSDLKKKLGEAAQ